MRGICYASLLFTLLFILTGCQIAQSAFSRTTNNAGAAFSAATTTLAYVHEGKITAAYARSSFENYQSELSGLDQQLPAQGSVSDKHTIQQLLALYKPAMQAVSSPCLDITCHWQAQLTALKQASAAFLKAGGS